MRKYIGEEPKRKRVRRRVTVVAEMRAVLEYILPIAWGICAVLILLSRFFPS